MAKNIFLQHTATPLPYASQSGGGGLKYPVRDDPDAHAKFISRKLQESRAQDLTQRQVAAIRYKEGLYLEFSGAAQCDLAIKQLENLQKGIRLLNVKKRITILLEQPFIFQLDRRHISLKKFRHMECQLETRKTQKITIL